MIMAEEQTLGHFLLPRAEAVLARLIAERILATYTCCRHCLPRVTVAPRRCGDTSDCWKIGKALAVLNGLPRATAAHAHKMWDRFTLLPRILIPLALVVHPFSSPSRVSRSSL